MLSPFVEDGIMVTERWPRQVDIMTGDMVVLLTAIGVLFIAIAFACAIAFILWR
jgi:hypothetical protein